MIIKKQDGFIYNETEEGVELLGYTGEEKDLIIPSYLDGKEVKIINEGAFEDKGLTSIQLPQTLTKLGDKAFKGNSIEGEVEIPYGVERVGRETFADNNIQSVKMTENTKEVGDWAFASNKMESIDLHDNLNSIGHGSFHDNNIQGEVEVPENIQSIGSYAFEENQIEKVNLRNKFVELGESPFSDQKSGREPMIDKRNVKERMHDISWNNKGEVEEIESNQFYQDNADQLEWKGVASTHKINTDVYFENEKYFENHKEELLSNPNISDSYLINYLEKQKEQEVEKERQEAQRRSL